MPKKEKFDHSGYRGVRMARCPERGLYCDGCGQAIEPKHKFIDAFRDDHLRYAFHAIECMVLHHSRISGRRKVSRQDAAGWRELDINLRSNGRPPADPVNTTRKFGQRRAPRLDTDLRQGPNSVRNRAIMLGEHFSRHAVFERDEWTCHICKLPVDRSKRGHYPTAPSLDHVIALHEGGTHSMSNAACSHAHCNSAKRAKRQMTGVELTRLHNTILRHLRKDGVYSTAKSA